MTKRQAFGLLSLAELLGMSVWFSASAVVPALAGAWGLNASGQAWLTMSVQLGFVAGTLVSAILNLADRVAARWLFAASSVLAGAATLAVAVLADGLPVALALRFIAGACLAGVYPVGMKIMATWTREDRGFGVGLLVGALTLGSAMPHLIKAWGGTAAWKPVLAGSGGLAVVGGLVAAAFVAEGPYRTEAPKFDWKFAATIWRDRPIALANLGYFGHMWELYAAWTWVPVFLVASFRQAGAGERWGALAGFAFIAAGSAGSLVAGKLADRVGRTAVTSAAMGVSGVCSLLIGSLFGGPPWLLTALALVWGFAVVADSAQFSAGVSELAPPDRIGTVLTIQTSLGFLLTLVTIRLVPALERLVTWRWAFALLALGPAAGIGAMLRLRRRPESARMAGGHR